MVALRQVVQRDAALRLQHHDRPGMDLALQFADQAEQVVEAALEVGEGGTEEDHDGFGRRPPALDPAVDVGASDAGRRADAEVGDVPLQLGDQPEIALDERDRRGAAAEGFQPDDAGAGEDVEERPAGHGVAEDAEEGLAHHLRRRAEVGVDRAGNLPALERAGHDPQLRAHEGTPPWEDLLRKAYGEANDKGRGRGGDDRGVDRRGRRVRAGSRDAGTGRAGSRRRRR